MDLDLVALECALERDDGLDQQWVGVLEVQVHDGHHSYAHQLCLVECLHLVDVIFVDGGGDEFWLFGGAHLGLVDVFEGCHVWVLVSGFVRGKEEGGGGRRQTLLLVDQEMSVGVDGDDDYVRQDISRSHQIEGIWIIERDSFRDLHHSEDDDQVGTVTCQSLFHIPQLPRR